MAVRDPSYAIQLAVVAALQASPDMAAAFGGTPAVYDSVPLDTSGSNFSAASFSCSLSSASRSSGYWSASAFGG